MHHHQQQQELPPHSTNVDEELERIQQALAAVFSPTPPTDWNRQRADRYLVSFQSTPTAWMVCDRLLASQDLNHLFFAAQTLCSKCRTDVQQLPEASLGSLRDSLVNHVSTQESPVVRTRLAMALAALAVQMGWNTIVTDLLGTQSPTLIQAVLQVLPEECASDRLYLRDENLRFQMRDHLVDTSKFVLQENMGLALWQAWIRFVPVNVHVLAQSVVPSAVFEKLQNPETMELAMDVLVELLHMYPSHIPQNQVLISLLLPKLLALPLKAALQSDDEDVVRGYCRVVTEMGESYLSLVCNTQAHPIVERVLECTSIEQTEICSMTLHFWYRFTTDLESVEPLSQRQELVDSYTPHLLQLLDILLRHLQYPPNLEDLSPDRTDDLHRDRYYIGDTLQDCCRLLGGHTVLARMAKGFPSPIHKWHPVEACLYGIQCISNYIPPDESQYLPHLMGILSQLPNVMPLRYTACCTIGKYAPWLARHSNYLQPLLPYLAESLRLSKCARAAAIAIKELCCEISLGDSVLELYSQVSLDLSDELELLEGVCRTISRQENSQEYLVRLIQPLGNRWTHSLQQDSTTMKQVTAEMERLMVIMRFLQVSGSARLEIMKSSWTLLEQSCTKFPHEFRLAESVCRLHKHTLRACTAPVYAPLLDPLIAFIQNAFSQSHQSPYLYLASICITEYGRDPSCTERLMNLISILAQTSFSFLKSLQDFVLHPDVVEELFYLMGRMLKYCPGPLVTSPLMASLYQCALVGMQLDHVDANRGTLCFLEASVDHASSHSQELQQVVESLLKALVGELPAYSIDAGSGSIAGILWKLRGNEMLRQWMASALHDKVPPQLQKDLVSALDTSRDRFEFNAAIRAFRSECRRHKKLNV